MKQIINYYRQCYQADNRTTSIYNFFSKKIEFQHFLDVPDLLAGIINTYPVPTSWGKEVESKLAIYSKEKQLYAGSFFLIGKGNVAGKTVRICAPMLLNPLELTKKEDVYYLSLKSGGNMINPSFITLLKPLYEGKLPLPDYLEEHLPKGVLDFDSCYKMEAALKPAFPDLDINALSQFPQLELEDSLQKAYKRTDSYKLVPAIGVGLLPNSQFSRGLLNELAEMMEMEAFSDPLKDLFYPTNNKQTKGRKQPQCFVHANLSAAQEAILLDSEKNTLTQVIGPPGTGKSFTIAALAVEAIGFGKSVLICSKNNQAVDVIGDKIKKEFDFENLVVRGGRSDYKRGIKDRLKNIINGISIEKFHRKAVLNKKKEVKQRQKELTALEKTINKRELDELKRGALFEVADPKILNRIKRKIASFKIDGEAPYWDLIAQVDKEMIWVYQRIYNYLHSFYNFQLSESLANNRKAFQNLDRAISGRTGNRKEAFFNQIDFSFLLKALPIWLVNSNDINTILPLRKELFDLVIIDEASQCDIASSLPLLFRAKKAIVVGDPKQLRHLSFLSRTKQLSLIQKLGLGELDYQLLDYRNQSILDLVSENLSSQAQVHFLDEHYRSVPAIIEFSNQQFYGNALKIMTQLSDTQHEQPLQIVHCGGTKAQNNINQAEIDKVLEKVHSIIEKEKNLEPRHCQSIGILSPFRSQTTAFQKLLETQFTLAQINRHQLLVGTPHSFQGEERDVMLLSFVVDDDCHRSTYQYLNKEDVFNVSITRARHLQILFISCSPTSLSIDNLLRKYLNATSTYAMKTKEAIRKPAVEKFQKEVIQVLEDIDIEEVLPGYELAGFEIDILCVHKNKTFAIDLIGYPGPFRKSFTLNGYKTLFRIGVHVLVLPYSLWELQRESCITMLKKKLLLDD